MSSWNLVGIACHQENPKTHCCLGYWRAVAVLLIKTELCELAIDRY